jgi:hypothetical protein
MYVRQPLKYANVLNYVFFQFKVEYVRLHTSSHSISV